MAGAWETLRQAIEQKQPVAVIYHGLRRVLCPHALGWKHGRAKVLAYQSGGRTSRGPLPADPSQRWRCLFVDEIERVEIVNSSWATWSNYSRSSSCLEQPPAHEVGAP